MQTRRPVRLTPLGSFVAALASVVAYFAALAVLYVLLAHLFGVADVQDF